MKRLFWQRGWIVLCVLSLLLGGFAGCGKPKEEGDDDPNYYKGKDFVRPGSGGKTSGKKTANDDY